MPTCLIVLISVASVIGYIALWIITALIGVNFLDKDEDFSIICIFWPIVLPIMLLHLLLRKIFG